jgi:hypothetical protein
MFGWFRRRQLTAAEVLGAPQVVVPPYRWPDGAPLLPTWAEVEASLRQERAVVFISVEWATQERRSRATFAAFVGRITRDHPGLGVWFGVVNEYSEGIDRWFETLALPGSAATGYGALVWLQRGRTVGLVPYAAEAGAEELVSRTLRLWGGAEPDAAAAGGA